MVMQDEEKRQHTASLRNEINHIMVPGRCRLAPNITCFHVSRLLLVALLEYSTRCWNYTVGERSMFIWFRSRQIYDDMRLNYRQVIQLLYIG